MQHRWSSVRFRSGRRLGGNHEQEFVQLRMAQRCDVPFRDFAKAIPLFEICARGPRDIGREWAERCRVGQTRCVDDHVVARASIGGHRDTKGRLREDKPRVSFGGLGFRGVEQRNVERSVARDARRQRQAPRPSKNPITGVLARRALHDRVSRRGTTVFGLSGPWSQSWTLEMFGIP